MDVVWQADKGRPHTRYCPWLSYASLTFTGRQEGGKDQDELFEVTDESIIGSPRSWRGLRPIPTISGAEYVTCLGSGATLAGGSVSGLPGTTADISDPSVSYRGIIVLFLCLTRQRHTNSKH